MASATAHEVLCLEREDLAADALGLGVEEAKRLLAGVQERMVAAQARLALAGEAACPGCGRAHRHQDSRQIVVRSLFGTLRVQSPRWLGCPCAFRGHAHLQPPRRAAAHPRAGLPGAKFAGLVSCGLSARLLAEVLPLGRPLHPTAVRLHAQAVAQRLEDDLGPEQTSFIEGCPAEWQQLPRPDLPIIVGPDGASCTRPTSARAARAGSR